MPLARKFFERHRLPLDRLVFIDDSPHQVEINGHAVLSYAEFLATPARDRYATLAIANASVRERLAARCVRDALLSWTVRAEVSEIYDDVVIGEGAIICAYVTLTSNIRIGKHFHANLYSYVEHDCNIGDFVTFAPGVKCNGNVEIGDHAYIGAGATIRQGQPGKPLRIGKGAIIGMGAVVTKDVAAHTTVVGNPARLIQKGTKHD
ncbi:acetyltransferase [Rhizobium sp. Root1203]|nr:acetyltransferase [Rhizobium sp. Root1203]